MAEMILLNYRPDIMGGNNSVLALLFDMNKLWEEYIATQIRKSLKPGWRVHTHTTSIFWGLDNSNRSKLIIPDLFVTNNQGRSVIIDTKWKLLTDYVPDDADLKQIYAYNKYHKTPHGLLLYPSEEYLESLMYKGGSYLTQENIKCGTAKVSLLNADGGYLDKNLGRKIMSFVEAGQF